MLKCDLECYGMSDYISKYLKPYYIVMEDVKKAEDLVGSQLAFFKIAKNAESDLTKPKSQIETLLRFKPYVEV